MSNTYSVLTLVPFSVSALLRQEAAALTLTSPTKGAVKAPNGSKSNLTQDGKRGKGPGHCIVQRWPSDKLPGSWGERNRAVLLDKIIQPTIWPKFSNSGHHALYPRATHSRLVTPLRSNDHGNEEGYRAPMAKILERLSAIAFIFFLNQWLLPENEQHPDLPAVLETLKHFEVKEEHTCKNLYGDVLRSDVVIQVGFDTPLPISKPLLGSTIVTMSMVNLKSSGNAEYQYASAFTSPSSGKLISSVDECMDHLISFATSCPTKGTSVQELSKFISKETSLEWAQTATSHFSQMAYELDVCASSCGVFSTIWGFHRIGLLKYSSNGDGDNILYVSDNLAAGRDRMDLVSNQNIIEGLFFVIVSSILLTYGETIVPPNLRNENFLSYYRG